MSCMARYSQNPNKQYRQGERQAGRKADAAKGRRGEKQAGRKAGGASKCQLFSLMEVWALRNAFQVDCFNYGTE